MFTTLRSNSQNLNRIAAILSGVVLFIALAGMLGWVFDLHLLRTFLPGRVAMKFNTALGLFASGVALLSVSGRQHFRVPIVLYVCAAFITCLGALTLAEYVFKWNAGFDDLFFSESIESSRALFPGRMSPHSAATFCFCGVAFLFFFSRARWQRFLFWTTLTLAAFVALVALAGHFYGAL